MLSKASDPTLRVQFNMGKARSRTLALPWPLANSAVVVAHLPADRTKHSILIWEACPMSTPVNLALARYATKA